MGYSLRIGEAEIEYDEERVGIDCPLVRLDTAPANGDPTDYENQRWPSYSCWADAMRKLDLMDVMFGMRNGGSGTFEWNGVERYPLLEEHPGVMPITREHVEYVEAKIAKYRKKHPEHIAQYPPLKPDAKPVVDGCDLYADDQYVDDPRCDTALVRGEWLAFWLRWAIENCKQPVFVNS
ncbi:MAG: hypothetical protein E6R03_05590 [Hyphomicrobiaceae bacterium]|nr:MAG: hypothetical protein E6R03_05590 [Hyphomicrobiaceae bacterium]